MGYPVQTSGLALLLLGAVRAYAADELQGPPGITVPAQFAAFDANAPRCSAPVGLHPVLAFIQENDRKFLEGVNHGLSLAAADRGLMYERVLANSDAETAATEIQRMVDAKVGAMVATSSNPSVVRQSVTRAIWSGAFVGSVVPPPATLILNAPQYQTGKILAEKAVAHIKGKLNGNAKVVILTQDTLQFLAPRFQAMRDDLSQLPGVTIVADIAPKTVTEQGGYEVMVRVLAAIPDIDVVLGADSVVLGALRALREAKKDRPDQFLGGIDGEPEAIAEIKSGVGPYKASIALNSPVFGYAIGQFGADWLAGRSVPQAMDILPMALDGDNLAAYEADLENPAPAFSDPVRRDSYLRMYGNICYDTRDQYVNFPWSSEKP